MRYAPTYDKDLANQFFLRTFDALAPDGKFPGAKFSQEEFAYMAARLSETAVFPRGERIGSPWERENPKVLMWTTRNASNRSVSEKAERAANQLLIREGMVRRNLENLMAKFDRTVQRKKNEVVEALYWNASSWTGLSTPERFVLRRMSLNVEPWMELLSLVPGNDYFELLTTQPPSLLVS